MVYSMTPYVLRCLLCQRVYTPEEVAYICPHHGQEGILDVVYDYAALQRSVTPQTLPAGPDLGMWRYRPFLPISPAAALPPLTVGWTPLYDAPRLAQSLGLRRVWVKDDGRNPTASLKDRASALAVVKARDSLTAGPTVIATASTGNAAAALAGLAASVQQPVVIFVPATAPPAKIAQLLVFGATVLLVEGSYDEAFDLCLQAAATFGWYNRNTAYNPYMTEGKKTVSYEICEQLTLALGPSPDGPPWRTPEAIFVSVGDGCILGGVHKGLKDLLALGWIAHMPRLFGVQAAGSNFLAQAWRRGEDVLTKAPIQAHTVADSISAGLPRDRLKAMAAVRESGGQFVEVEDAAILAAIPVLARGCGVFAEPAGAAAYAGLVQAVAEGWLPPEAEVVVINTGNGLKDVASARQAVTHVGPQPHTIPPTLSAVQAALGLAGRSVV